MGNLLFQNRRVRGLVLSFLVLAVATGTAAFATPLLTEWAKEVTPTNVHQEYPRPQLVRDAWQNLNGEWDYEITKDQANPPRQFTGKILTPFPIESYLSGVGRSLDERGFIWYRREFKVPSFWKDKLVRLNFGGVDWSAKVIVNGQVLGIHTGGYDAFSFDITRALNWDGTNELIVVVSDPTEGDQPRGKQTRRAEGIFYTPCSGIWQTVWLEPVPQDYVQSLDFLTDIAEPALHVTVMANSLAPELRAQVIVTYAGQEVGRGFGVPGRELRVPLKEKHLWSPDHPNLYDVAVLLYRGTERLDRVNSYFGLRDIKVATDSSGVRRLFLNGEPTFQIGVLDQGFWPDGIYTAPTDAALRFDLETAKKLGFNLIRKHVKVEPERWYFWADKLGLLVWQDMPSGNNASEAGRREFQAELDRIIDQKGNHPCIVTWVLFNEGWGQFDTERLARRIKSADPSRLVDSASGWTDLKVGDVMDLHSYPLPMAPPLEPVRAGVLGEFGGLGLGITNHIWEARQPWGYQILPNVDRLTEEYVSLLSKVWNLHKGNGLAAAVYTQLIDVETECNGFLTYDRKVMKMDLASVYRANRNTPKILPDARDGSYAWAYTLEQPADDWMQPNFDSSTWKTGNAGFGSPNPPNAIINTEWKSQDIWLRREFTMDYGFKIPSSLMMYHDEDAEVYINGILAVTAEKYTVGYKDYPISQEAGRALKPGRNVIAVHCHQTGGGQYIDIGIWPEFEIR